MNPEDLHKAREYIINVVAQHIANRVLDKDLIEYSEHLIRSRIDYVAWRSQDDGNRGPYLYRQQIIGTAALEDLILAIEERAIALYDSQEIDQAFVDEMKAELFGKDLYFLDVSTAYIYMMQYAKRFGKKLSEL